MRKKSPIALTSYEDLFRDERRETVEQLPLDQLEEFPNHPYSVPDNEELAMLRDSIIENGVLQPIVVVEKEEGNGFLIISGHRRCLAARKAGLAEIPGIIRTGISMAQATIEMVDANLYREHILPSEKAKAYKLRMEALKSEPKQRRSASNRGEIIADQVGESKATIHRYLRLNYLIPELLAQVDNSTISLFAGNVLSFLKSDQQKEIFKYMRPTGVTIEQANQLKKAYEDGLWDKKIVKHILRDLPKKEMALEPEEEEILEEVDIASLKRQMTERNGNERIRESFDSEEIEKRILELKVLSGKTMAEQMELEGLKLLAKKMQTQFYVNNPEEIPEMKDQNEIRDWMRSHKGFAIWSYDPADDSRYYRFDFINNTSLVVKETPYSDMVAERIECRRRYFLIPEDNEYVALADCESNERECIRRVEEVFQLQHSLEEEEEEEPVLVL